MSNKYQLIDSGDFKKLEQVGPYRLVRPSPNAVWSPTLGAKDWVQHDAEFLRYSEGQGEWKIKNSALNNASWPIDVHGVTFNLKLTSFGHLGIFSEQEKNWLQIEKIIRTRKQKNVGAEFRVLNLFAYTGGSSLFSARGGAEVVHVDASKGSVAWARENAESSSLADKPIRWIIDDVQEFVKKEIRRAKTYQGIILDPPSYGRGQKNQVWKIEEHLVPFLQDLQKIMAPDFAFLLLSAHSPGYSPVSLENLVRQVTKGGQMESGEMLIHDQNRKPLPSGAYSLFSDI